MEVATLETDHIQEAFVDPGPYGVIPKETFIVLGTVFAVVGFTGSALLTAVCCLDVELRHSSKHFLIVSVCILCFLEQCLGSFIVHTHVYSIDILTTYGCDVLYIISASGYISVSVVILLVVCIAFDTVLTICMHASTATGVRICIALELVAMAITVSVLMLLPFMGVNDHENTCSIYVGENYMLALNVLHVLPQAMVLVLANLVLFLVYRTKHGRRPEEETPLPFPVDIYLATVLLILLKLPDFIFSLGFNVCAEPPESCDGMYIFWAVSTYSNTVMYVLLPYAWLAGKDTRDGMRRIVSCRLCRTPAYHQDSYILTSPEEV